MTVREYLSDKLRAFGITEAWLDDSSRSAGIAMDGDMAEYDPVVIGRALTVMIEELILAPRISNVSESGFSMSWDFSNLAKYYIWLCKRWGVPRNEDVVAMAGISSIIDKSDIW